MYVLKQLKAILIMNEKTEHQKASGQTVATPALEVQQTIAPGSKCMPSKEQWQQWGWSGANFLTVAGVTSASIVAVQSPVKTILTNLSKSGTMLPAYTGGVWGLGRVLFAGTKASATSSLTRTAYVANAKGSTKPIEEPPLRDEADLVKEEPQSLGKSKPKLGHVMSLAFGDILVTQIPESLSTLKKVPDLLPDTFKWYKPHNAWILMTGGVVPRYVAGMGNFAALCVLEDRIAASISIQDKRVAHFASGALSGMGAAFLTYPLSAFQDHLLVQSTVKDGLLQNKGTFSTLKEIGAIVLADPKASFKSFGSMALKQVPIRMGLTGAIFSIVAGVGETLGTEPLKNIVPEEYQHVSSGRSRFGMFATSPAKIEELPEVPVEDRGYMESANASI